MVGLRVALDALWVALGAGVAILVGAAAITVMGRWRR